MDRKSEDRTLVGKDRRGAVSLVGVAVDDDRSLGSALSLDHTRSNGAVVKHAVTLTIVSEGMMGAASETNGQAVFRGSAAGVNGRATRPADAFDHLHGPGKPDASNLSLRQFSMLDTTEILWIMSSKNLFISRRMGNVQVLSRNQSGFTDLLPEKGVFLHWKAVSSWEREHEIIGVEDLQAWSLPTLTILSKRFAWAVCFCFSLEA